MEGRPASLGRLESRMRPQPEHANNGGNMHGGYILYHLDTYCGMTAARFSGMRVVTVSVDRMDFARPVTLGANLLFKTSVNMAHRHSMEVGARIELENARTLDVTHVGTAYLTFVALDANGRPTNVPPLIPETDEDRRRMADAVRRSYMRRMERAQSKGKAFAFSIELLPDSFFLCRFAPGVTPPLLPPGNFTLCAAADNETTLVFPESGQSDGVVNAVCKADGVRMEKGWRAFAVRDALDLSVSGVAAALSAVLAAEHISVQYVSTFSSGYLLVRGDAVAEAAEALRFAGHTVFPL
ncbi:Thioesterase superfamily protein (modular protein) [uncultured delta proteobacterium]|uniref:Thioesterase superfamily protein (Modular protein) n=1 Tax=uncultured delta proteobacterium TaxID=34034 RepID=A0A212JUD8_9DELT|nr:Thioesterase superfamily protein (modular protein) [uncultured delta proteobacterium]